MSLFMQSLPSLPDGAPPLCFKLCSNIASSGMSFLRKRFSIPLLEGYFIWYCIKIYLHTVLPKTFEGQSVSWLSMCSPQCLTQSFVCTTEVCYLIQWFRLFFLGTQIDDVLELPKQVLVRWLSSKEQNVGGIDYSTSRSGP